MNKKNRKPGRNAKLTASDIIRRLPALQQLNKSQAALVQLSPIWEKWASQAIKENKISSECYLSTTLVGLSNGKLIINCSTAIFASQIKHQQQSILDSIRKTGITSVEHIAVQLVLPSLQDSNRAVRKNLDQKSSAAFTPEPLTSNSLEAIENCHKSVGNDSLANSLKRLAETLKKQNS